MKGCLKLTSCPDSQVHHLDGLNKPGGGARCCHIPTTTSSSDTASPSSCTTATTDAANTIQSQSQTHTHRKCVAFCAKGSETVYTADEWDRTPTEPARKLSYQDLLELKEIQRSLPHANQPPDVATGRPGKHFLSGVPIILLPLLGSDASASGVDEGRAKEGEAKKSSSSDYFSAAHGRINGNGTSWGPPSLTGFGRQAQQAQPPTQTQAQQTTPVRPPFPFPPRPIPFSAPASMTTFTSARAPGPPTSPSPITQPWRMNVQSQSKTSTSPPFHYSPTAPYPAPYPNRTSSTSTSPTYLPQQHNQTRTAWSPPPSLSHLMPSRPVKPREKPKFEFITLLDTGAGSDGGSTPAAVTPGGVNGVGTPTTKVGPEVLHPISKFPSGLIEGKLERDHHHHHHHHHHDEHDLEDHDQDDHDLISVTSSCPSLCASSCCPSSCSASEVDTDHEHEPEIDTEGQHHSPKGYSGLDSYDYAVAKGWRGGNENGAAKFFRPTCTTTSLDLDINLPWDDEVKRDKMVKKKPESKEKKKRFILVNDMEIELDDSESESDCQEDSVASSGRITSTSISTTRETTTTTTTKTTTTEKTTTTTTTTTSSSGSPSGIMAPLPVKSALWGSSPPPSSSASVSLITPPTTPPSEQIARYGANNKPNHSPTSSPSAASRGWKAIQKKCQIVGNSSSRERSGSIGSDTSGGSVGSSPSPSRNCNTVKIGSPVKSAGLRRR